MVLVEHQATDTRFFVEGNRLISRDVIDGELSVLKYQCGEYQSPEHAEIVGCILSDPMAFVCFASGKITQEHIDQAAESLRKRREVADAGTSTAG